MSHEIIRAAIETRLLAWAKSQTPPIPVAFENVDYKPVTGQRFLQGHLMPADTLNPSEGAAHRRYHGLYQISVRTSIGRGTTEASALTKAIEELFPRATALPRANINVRIDSTPTVGPGGADEGFWMTPITIKYRAEVFS